ncbi:hypothetical protein BKA67DRAFT_657457 [Truncatella angustata]|uniref:Uncharacterized protein n=1 Tax=Truncatella angustata TaxID=152316 RepID=A0A9P8UP34_9PEZI|nr:uncharacterized protein BKA67DRAFT_657457 [Truncatella angustata]KAH6655526.1 hypothetical protein BKA67DRAFT_657457 [Truncatella angustata]
MLFTNFTASLILFVALTAASPAPRSALSVRGEANCNCAADTPVPPIRANCDAAATLIIPSRTYLVSGTEGAGSFSGVCALGCAIHVRGEGCKAQGSVLTSSYNAIRAFGCNGCGVDSFGNGCEIRVESC